MLVSDYNYNLPEERIAKFPPKERGSTRLLVLNRQTGAIQDSHYKDLADFLIYHVYKSPVNKTQIRGDGFGDSMRIAYLCKEYRNMLPVNCHE